MRTCASKIVLMDPHLQRNRIEEGSVRMVLRGKTGAFQSPMDFNTFPKVSSLEVAKRNIYHPFSLQRNMFRFLKDRNRVKHGEDDMRLELNVYQKIAVEVTSRYLDFCKQRNI